MKTGVFVMLVIVSINFVDILFNDSVNGGKVVIESNKYTITAYFFLLILLVYVSFFYNNKDTKSNSWKDKAKVSDPQIRQSSSTKK